MKWFSRLFGIKQELPDRLLKLELDFLRLQERVVIAERELDDLHARYRRLRALQAADASISARVALEPAQGDPEVPVIGAQNISKNALRLRVLRDLNKKGNSLARHEPEESA